MWKFNMCITHPWTFRPQITNYQFKLYIKQWMCRIWTQAKHRIDKQSKPNKITSTAEIKWQRLREERCKHKDNTQCVIEEETEALGIKPLCRPPSGK